jgi:O-methyltransferase involved in polyketide biosynthesis
MYRYHDFDTFFSFSLCDIVSTLYRRDGDDMQRWGMRTITECLEKCALTNCLQRRADISAGLDATLYRVYNGLIQWYDLELSPVIKVRKQVLPETDRVTYVAKSILDPIWCKDIKYTCLLFAVVFKG